MVRLLLALLLFVSLPRARSQALNEEEVRDKSPELGVDEWNELPDAPSALVSEGSPSASETTKFSFERFNPVVGFPAASEDVVKAFSHTTFDNQSKTGR